MSTSPSAEILDTSEAYDERLLSRYEAVRAASELICEPLAIDDYQLQSIVETSPPKWHLAHVSWFFETFVLSHFRKDYRSYHPDFNYIFNSYYYTVGNMHPRPKRGMLSRPTVEEVYNYRRHVDEQMRTLMASVGSSQWEDLAFRVTLGLNHEQQHQELLLMDIKHNLSVNPLQPTYRSDLPESLTVATPISWEERVGGLYEIGHSGKGFSFDNETPSHQVLLQDHSLANRLVTNREYLEFIDDGGYQQPALWMADGWTLINQHDWQHPLYWRFDESLWREYTLGGMRDLHPDQPVSHVSFFEADAFARWAGKRLPSEAELELMLNEQQKEEGNFYKTGYLHPMAALPKGQWFGDLWNWTSTSYASYPGFRPLKGAMGEYNGKFMSNQMVLKGGCCVTPSDHIRASYRNFYYPHDRWPFTGIRLAEDL
ncbi:MAG: ergothioneine biosynthesis protein EgtB [Candidatus Thiodiazotropha sp. (ex Notomyrtea botanica)]|nr:ergothioneine biosynthesis protein EgtB [Candidatus Thiodiazotropha sp. (ex Notomyrtea botanica)]